MRRLETQGGIAAGYIALLAGSIILMAIAYAADQVSGDMVLTLGLFAVAAFGWFAGRLYRRPLWPIAAFAAAGAVFLYTEIVRYFLEFYRVGVLNWNSSLFRDFSMYTTLLSTLAEIIAAAAASAAALVGRSRHSLQPPAEAAPLRGARSFLLSGPAFAIAVGVASILVGLAEQLAFRSSLAAGLAMGGVWLLAVAAAAWRTGRFHARNSAVLAFLAGTGLSHWLLSLHDAYIVKLWYVDLDGDIAERVSGAGMLDWAGLQVLAAVCGVISGAVAISRK